MKKRLKQCRSCSNWFSLIRGIKHMDSVCCSEKCYLLAGPIKPTVSLKPLTEPTTRKGRQAQRKSRRDDKQKYYDFYRQDSWLELRYKVLAKYGRTCMCCGKTKGEMHVDHIQPKSRRPDLALEFDNLQILCKDCNLGKLNRDNKDFRPKSDTP